MNNINLNWLKVFLSVATSNSFLDASRKLYISQPAISKSIKQLEEELNVNLFYRGNKGICLTPEGEKLLDYVKDANNLLLAAERMISQNTELKSGSLIIGAQSHIVRYYLLNRIEEFRKQYPNIFIRVIDLSTKDLLEALEKHSVDIVIDSSPIDLIYNNTIIKPITYLNTCFIKSSKNNNIINTPKDLLENNIILPLPRSSLRKTLEKELEIDNIKLNPILEYETEELIIESVIRNLGIGFVVENAVEREIRENQIKKIDLSYTLPKVEINLVYVEHYLPKIAKIFINDFILGGNNK